MATGATSEFLIEFGNVTSIEYDNDCISSVQGKLNLKIDRGDITNLQYLPDSFDLVCAFDVLEHISNDKLAVQEILRVCKPGGQILITVPANMSLWSEHDEINHHFRRYTITEISNLFDIPNYQKVFISYFNSSLSPIIRIYRVSKRFLKRKTKLLKSDFNSFKTPFLNKVLFKIMNREAQKISNQIPFKRGVSIIAHFVKS